MPHSCPECAAQMPEAAAFCPGCGRAMQTVERAQGKVGTLPENVAGAIAYLTFLPAIFFLSLTPYNRNRFLRFHSLQCLFTCAAVLAGAALLRLAALVLYRIPVVGPLLVVLIFVVAIFALIVIWMILIVKALQGESFKLPVLGGLAEGYAGPV